MPDLKQFLKFFGVGVAATATDWSAFFGLTHFLGVDPVKAVAVAYCCGGVVSYTLNRLHTFDTDRTHVEAGWRFGVVMIIGFSASLLFVWLFADQLKLPPMIARMMSTAIVFFWNYIAHKTWTFAES
jgi:putative flippase GtrA